MGGQSIPSPEAQQEQNNERGENELWNPTTFQLSGLGKRQVSEVKDNM